MDSSEHAIIGLLMAVAIGLVKVLESAGTWAFKKWFSRHEDSKNGNGHSTKLDAETALALKEMHGIVSLKDQDGVPLVYWPRSQMETQKEMAKSLQDISRSQDRMVDRLEQIADNTRK